MRILYFSSEYHVKIGGGTHGREFLKAFRALPEVDVAEVFPPKPHEVSSNAGGKVRPVRSKFWFLPKKVQRFIRFWLKPNRGLRDLLFSKIQSEEFDALIMRPDMNARMIPAIKRRFPRLPVLLEVNAAMFDENLAGLPLDRFWKRREVALLNTADHLFTVSQHLKDYLINLGGAEGKITVNPNGVNPDIFDSATVEAGDQVRARYNIPNDAFLFGYVGGMEPFRKLPLMVELFAEFLLSRQQECFLLIVGDGEDRKKIEDVIRRHSDVLAPRCICCGRLPYEQVPSVVNAFDAALFPFSNPYGSPQKLFEYMAMGVPVIGPDVPVVREVFETDEHIILASKSGFDFVDCLEYVYYNANVCKRMASRSKEYVLKNYPWVHNARRVERELKKYVF